MIDFFPYTHADLVSTVWQHFLRSCLSYTLEEDVQLINSEERVLTKYEINHKNIAFLLFLGKSGNSLRN